LQKQHLLLAHEEIEEAEFSLPIVDEASRIYDLCFYRPLIQN
jgi:hypothetical protein